MKTTVLLLIATAAMLLAAGCEGETHHHDEGPYGGANEGYSTASSQGQGEYIGYPDYPEYRHEQDQE
jgi:hypothetical protein